MYVTKRGATLRPGQYQASNVPVKTRRIPDTPTGPVVRGPYANRSAARTFRRSQVQSGRETFRDLKVMTATPTMATKTSKCKWLERKLGMHVVGVELRLYRLSLDIYSGVEWQPLVASRDQLTT
jgi:hypothetical protein